jgi:hypothetical protein
MLARASGTDESSLSRPTRPRGREFPLRTRGRTPPVRPSSLAPVQTNLARAAPPEKVVPILVRRLECAVGIAVLVRGPPLEGAPARPTTPSVILAKGQAADDSPDKSGSRLAGRPSEAGVTLGVTCVSAAPKLNRIRDLPRLCASHSLRQGPSGGTSLNLPQRETKGPTGCDAGGAKTH